MTTKEIDPIICLLSIRYIHFVVYSIMVIPRKVHIILTGASGYLGQHLLSDWIQNGLTDIGDSQFKITALYNKSETFPKALKAFQENQPCHPTISGVVPSSLDLTNPSESDIDSLLQPQSFTMLVHAAALSSPRVCQANPETARAVNVPTKFLDALLLKASACIVALSTDQVYDGKQVSGSYYKEDEKEGLQPVNVYGQTKLELEAYLSKQQNQSRMVALRSSIILGPKAPIDPDGAHGTFLDFCQSRGKDDEATTFFTNEYRSVVRVDTVIQTVNGVLSKMASDSSELSSVVYNMGGPFRVNRMEMATAVFRKFGYDSSLLIEAEQSSSMSPLDISMDSSLLIKDEIIQQQKAQTQDAFLKELVDYVFAAAQE